MLEEQVKRGGLTVNNTGTDRWDVGIEVCCRCISDVKMQKATPIII